MEDRKYGSYLGMGVVKRHKQSQCHFISCVSSSPPNLSPLMAIPPTKVTVPRETAAAPEQTKKAALIIHVPSSSSTSRWLKERSPRSTSRIKSPSSS